MKVEIPETGVSLRSVALPEIVVGQRTSCSRPACAPMAKDASG